MSSIGNAKLASSGREIRIQNHVSLPLDPLLIKSMAEYNFALLNFRNWFEYDEGRKPLPGIIERWEFNAEVGQYTFFISKSAKWSDGSSITASDLKYNLDRAIALNTTYGKSISAITDLSRFHEVSPQKFQIITRDKKPSISFFERMGSIFLAVVNPKDVDTKTWKVKANVFSAGPYVIANDSDIGIELVQNKYFPIRENAASKIVLGKINTPFNLDSFLSGKSWENLAQFTSFVSADWEEKIVKQKLPYWTRGHDRVSLFRPGFGKKNEQGKRLIRAINANLCTHSISGHLPFNVARAYSLQPESYPLHHEKLKCGTERISQSKIKILATDTPLVKFHIEVLKELFKELNLEAEWDIQPFSKYIQAIGQSEEHDIIFLNFGVADPEPSTWISLIRDAKFVDFDKKDVSEINEILKVENRADSVRRYTDVLKESFKKGGYAPLFFASTLALGHKGLSFKHMRELDETVNLSKVVFE